MPSAEIKRHSLFHQDILIIYFCAVIIYHLFLYSVKQFDEHQDSGDNDEEQRELSGQLEEESVNQHLLVPPMNNEEE